MSSFQCPKYEVLYSVKTTKNLFEMCASFHLMYEFIVKK